MVKNPTPFLAEIFFHSLLETFQNNHFSIHFFLFNYRRTIRTKDPEQISLRKFGHQKEIKFDKIFQDDRKQVEKTLEVTGFTSFEGLSGRVLFMRSIRSNNRCIETSFRELF